MITFKAQLIRSCYITKKNQNNDIQSCPVSFVKLDMNNSSDTNALRQIALKWDKSKYMNYAKEIYDESKDTRFLSDKNFYNYEFYALTTQSNDFNKLNPKQVLGLLETENLSGNEIEIAYIQSIPEQSFANKTRTFFSIGKELIKSLNKLYPHKNIIVNSIDSAKDFYLKLGFTRVTNVEHILKAGEKIR